MALYLGIDLGTQGLKCVVYNGNTRKIVSRSSYNYDILPSPVAGRAEQHPDTWIQATKVAVREALSRLPRPADVCALGVSGQQHGLVALDQQGQVIRPAKLWCDTESAEEAAELSGKLGITLVPSFTLTKLLWLKRREAASWSRLAAVLLPGSYLNYWLTGEQAMEAGDASGTGGFDIRSLTWDEGALGHVDPELRGKMPRLVGPNELVGTVLPHVAEELGLPPGVVVSPGSGDNACSALGAGVVSDGQLVVSLGTSGTVFGKSSRPVIDPSGGIAPFCDATGGWLPLLCTLNCTKPVEDVRACFGMSHEEMSALAEKEAPGCGGVSYLPYLVGERTPNWPHATGVIAGLTPGSLRPGLLYRSALEGATLGLLGGLRRMQHLGMSAREVRLVGGGSRSALWRRIVADAFQLPVRLPLESESAALGAALQAAACHSGTPVAEYIAAHPPELSEEEVLPDPALQPVYAEALARHEALGRTLFEPSGAATAFRAGWA